MTISSSIENAYTLKTCEIESVSLNDITEKQDKIIEAVLSSNLKQSEIRQIRMLCLQHQ